jgi:hypothetical protein
MLEPDEVEAAMHRSIGQITTNEAKRAALMKAVQMPEGDYADTRKELAEEMGFKPGK